MASGYTRQAQANIQPNLNIDSADFNAEYNALANAMDNTSGHDHSGSSTGVGAKISLTTAVTGILPIANGGTGPTLVLPALNGGTGVANSSTITIAGNLITTGTGAITLAFPNSNITLTFPTASKTLLATDFSNVSGTLATANGGTGTTTATGTGSNVLQTSPTITTPTIASITGPTTITTTLVVTAGGLTVTAGGLVVTAGGLIVTAGGISVVAGGITAAGNSTINGTLSSTSTLTCDAGGLFVNAGGAFITGNTTISGTLTVSSTVSDSGTRVYSPSNPFVVGTGSYASVTGTASGSGVMAGLAFTITPTKSTQMFVCISGNMTTGTVADGVAINLRYGTGTPPVNGAALTGTIIGGATQVFYATDANMIGVFCRNTIVSGLSVNTTYWFDLSQTALTGGTTALTDVFISAHEI